MSVPALPPFKLMLMTSRTALLRDGISAPGSSTITASTAACASADTAAICCKPSGGCIRSRRMSVTSFIALQANA